MLIKPLGLMAYKLFSITNSGILLGLKSVILFVTVLSLVTFLRT